MSSSVSREEKAVALAAVRQKYGVLSPENVVLEAKDRKGVAFGIHQLFTWDDKRAAHERRVDQARTIIASVPLELTVGALKIIAPYYVHDERLPPGEQGYVPLLETKPESEVAREQMQAEINRASYALGRAHAVAIALGDQVQANAISNALSALQEVMAEAA